MATVAPPVPTPMPLSELVLHGLVTLLSYLG